MPTAMVVAVICWLTWCALATAVLWDRKGITGVAPLIGVAAILGLVAIVWAMRMAGAPPKRFRRAALEAHEILTVERLVLVAAFVAAGAGFRIAATLLVIAATLTLVSQKLLRTSYEFSQAGDRASGRPASDTQRRRRG